MKLHAFVAMPFGTKPGHDGHGGDWCSSTSQG